MQDHQITVSQAMSALNVTRLTVYNHIKTGKLQAEKAFLNGRAAWLINKSDIDFLTTQRDCLITQHNKQTS